MPDIKTKTNVNGGTPGAHGTSHQYSGSDEINVNNLSGDLADAQDPKTHAATHATGQADALAITAIGGDAAGTARPPTANVKAKTFADTGYNAIIDDSLYVDASGGVTSIVLPTAVVGNKGRRIQIKKTDSSVNNVSVTVNGGGNIDGAATFAWNSQYASYTFESDGIQWWLV